MYNQYKMGKKKQKVYLIKKGGRAWGFNPIYQLKYDLKKNEYGIEPLIKRQKVHLLTNALKYSLELGFTYINLSI